MVRKIVEKPPMLPVLLETFFAKAERCLLNSDRVNFDRFDRTAVALGVIDCIRSYDATKRIPPFIGMDS